tara:strand:+ start:29406 stop:30407 length:1002 start_codon:yes stop_codon:yes gene_type:complete
MKTITCGNYEVIIGENSIKSFNYTCYSKIAILVDENTKKNCLEKFLQEVRFLKNYFVIEISEGEQNKTIHTCSYIWDKLIEYEFDKNSLFVNLGGGLVSDIGGYCATNYKRGIDFINIPTTLLAMVDASIGGKLAVNHNNLKNQIGLFKNPVKVLINCYFLKTLSIQQINSGYAEIIKHTLISNKDAWENLKKNDLNNIIWETTIYNSISIKNNIVLQDPFENNLRKILNFGHTYGHAIESYYLEKNNPILHGEAVMMGMILESEISKLTQEDKIDIKEYIQYNFELPSFPNKKKLSKYLKFDKKNKDMKVNFSLLKEIGQCEFDVLIKSDEL